MKQHLSIGKICFRIKRKFFRLAIRLWSLYSKKVTLYQYFDDIMFQTIGQNLLHRIQEVGYGGFFVATFLENLIPPIPSEVIMPFGGYLASLGKLNLLWVIFVWSLWSTLGTLPYFYIGKLITKHRISAFVECYGRYVWYTTDKLDRLYNTFAENKEAWVFFGRFFPGARSFISLPAWSADMRWGKFIILTWSGTALWTTLWTLIGYRYGDNQSSVTELFHRYEQYGWSILIVLIIITIVWAVNRPMKEEM